MMIHRALFSRRHGSLPTFAALAFCAAVSGRASAQTPAAGGGSGKASGKEYVLAHPSSFTAPPAGERNPFWPIGWVPTAAVATATTAAPVLNVTADQFVVTSISVDTAGGLAVIDGKTRGVGDRLPVSADGKEFVTVKHIADGLVVLDYKGHELRCTPAGPGGARRPATK